MQPSNGGPTIAFTFFFRDTQTLSLAIDHLLPFIQSKQRIQIWSAGCAMGQEPYTFAILLREKLGVHLYRNVKIYATDLDMTGKYGPAVIAGEYLTKDLERIPPEIFRRYFEPSHRNDEYSVVIPEIRNAVQFYQHDLLTLQPITTDLQLIICKNVLLHLTPEEREKVWMMFYHALEEGGFMLHEHTQKLTEIIAPFFIQVVPNAQIFRKVRNEGH